MAVGRHRIAATGWRRCTLGELCREDRQLVEPFSARAAELPYLGLEHIEAGSGRITRDPAAPPNGEGRSTTFAFEPRHVLYGKLRPYLNKVATPDFAGRCTTELLPLLPAEGVDREFLAWVLRRPATVEAAMRHKTGARMPRADMQRLFALGVDIPSTLDEQRAIASRMLQRMKWVLEARDACRRQHELIERIALRLLSDFPTSGADSASD